MSSASNTADAAITTGSFKYLALPVEQSLYRNGKVLTGTFTLKKPGKLRFQYEKGVPILIVAEGGALTLLVSGQDRPGLFADLAGTLANLGANVVSAQVFTNRSGRIVDIFILQDASQKPFGQKDSTRLERLETALRDTLGGTRVTELATSRMGRRQAAFLGRGEKRPDLVPVKGYRLPVHA